MVELRHPGMKIRAGLTIALTLLVGCAVAPAPETPEVVQQALPDTAEVPEEWASEAGEVGAVDDGWIASFGDERLERWVEEALENNLNLELAATQVERATGVARLAGAALKPAVGLGVDWSGREAQKDLLSGSSTSGGVALSWELDVWGRVRAGARAGEEGLAASQYDYEFARQSIAAAVARTYFLSTEATLQWALAEEAVGIFERILELVQIKHEVGQISRKDVNLTAADLAEAQESRELAQSGYEQVLRALEILLGRYPKADLETAKTFVAVPPPFPVGMPADIIARRPDLIAAERRVAAAFFLTEQARLARLPSFSLSASLSSSSLTETIASLGAGLFAPLYTGGALEAQLDTATADQRAAIAVYGQSLLRAFQEVETALSNERLFARREEFLAVSVQENASALELARIQYDEGRIELLDVLQIQARWLGARSALISVRKERLSQRVDLHLALGGSFREKEALLVE